MMAERKMLMSPPPLAQSQIHYVLVDLSGTLHVGDCPIPGAIEAMNRLVSCTRTNNTHIKGVLFLTNTTTVARQTLFDSLHKEMGFASSIKDMDQIMTSAQAVEHYVTTHNLHPFCLVEDDLLKDLPFAQQQQLHDDDKDKDDCYYDSVLVGLSPSSFHYDALNRAFRILHKMKMKEAKETASSSSSKQPHRLLCFHQSKHVKSSQDGELSLGPGGFVACLEHTTDYSALVLGKPSSSFFQAAMSKLLLQSEANVEKETDDDDDKETIMATILRENVVMVGDDIVNDIMGARDAGIRHQILVQTGKYQDGDEKKLKSRPSLDGDGDDKDDVNNLVVVVPSIVEAVDYIMKHNAATISTAG